MIHSIPTYLKGQATEVDGKIFAEIQREYGEYSTVFKFNKKFKSIERTWLTEYDEFGSTVWGVTVDNKKVNIFNPIENGYNAMFDDIIEEDISSTKIIEFENEMDLIIMFQYGGEELEYAEEGKSKFAEDYFDWIAIYKYDNNGLQEIISIECA